MDSEDFMLNFIVVTAIVIVFTLFGIALGGELSSRNIKIQDVKQIEDGYYVMIDNRIYYKGVK